MLFYLLDCFVCANQSEKHSPTSWLSPIFITQPSSDNCAVVAVCIWMEIRVYSIAFSNIRASTQTVHFKIVLDTAYLNGINFIKTMLSK